MSTENSSHISKSELSKLTPFAFNISTTLKNNLFSVFHLSLKHESSKKTSLLIVLSFELLHLLSFSFSYPFETSWTIGTYGEIFTYLHKFFRAFLIVPFFKDFSYTLYLIIFFFSFFIVLLVIFLFIFLSFAINRNYVLSLYPVYIFNLISQYFCAIFFVPLSQAFLPLIHCSTFFQINKEQFTNFNETCHQTKTLLLTGVAYLGIIFSIIIGLCYSFFYNDLRMRKMNYMWKITTKLNAFMFVGKVAIIFCFEFLTNPNNSSGITPNKRLFLSFLLFAYSFFACCFLYKRYVFYHTLSQKAYKIYAQICLLTNSLLVCDAFLQKFSKARVDCLFEIWCLGVLAIPFYKLFLKDKSIYSLYQNPKEIAKVTIAIEYIITFTKMIFYYYDINEYNTLLHGVIIRHESTCLDQDCILKAYKKLAIGTPHDKMEIAEIKKESRKLLIAYTNDLFQHFITKFPKSVKLRILYCIFIIETKGKISLVKLNEYSARHSSPNLREEFDLYRISKFIDDAYLTFSDEILTLDIASTVVYDKYLKQFQEILTTIAKNYFDFWNIFQQEEVKMMRIRDLGFTLIEQIHYAFVIWNKMSKLIQKDSEAYRLFGAFLIDILNEREEGNAYIKKSKENISNQKLHFKLFKNELSKICFDGSPGIIANALENDTLAICSVTNSISRVFGYKKMELVGHDVNILLPKVFHQFHNDVIKNFVKHSSTGKTIIQKNIKGIALHKNGFLIPIKFIMALLPNLVTECNYAMILKKDKRAMSNLAYQCYFIVNRDFDILFMSSECMRIFGFNDKIFWNVKNYPKMQAEDRVNLKKYVVELGQGGFNSQKNFGIHKAGSAGNINFNLDNSFHIKLISAFQGSPEKDDASSTISLISRFLQEKDFNIHIVESTSGLNDSRIMLETPPEAAPQKTNLKSKTWKQNTPNKASSSNVMTSSNYSPLITMNIKEIFFGMTSTELYEVKIDYQLSSLPLMSLNSTTPKKGHLQSTTFIKNTTNSLLPQKRVCTILNDIKFYEKMGVYFDLNRSRYVIDNQENKENYKTTKIPSPFEMDLKENNHAPTTIIINSIQNEQSENESQLVSNINETSKFIHKESSISGTSTYEEDVYNTLGFRNYAQGVSFYELDSTTMTCSIFAKPIPKEGKRCADLRFFFDNDTLKAEDDINAYSNDDLWYKKAFEKTKFEIHKRDVFDSKYKHFLNESMIKVQASSFIIFLYHLCIATSSLVLYNDYINKTEDLTKSLSYITSSLNTTISSSNYFCDNLLYFNSKIISVDEATNLNDNITAILKYNSQTVYQIYSITNKVLTSTTDFIKNKYTTPDNNPIDIILTYVERYDLTQKVPTLSTRPYTYNQAIYEMMSSIFSLTLNFNQNIDFSDSEAFFLCYNTVNSFYIESLKYGDLIGKALTELVPKSDQMRILHLSIWPNLFFFGLIYYFITTAIKKINAVLTEFLYIKPNEIQYISIQSSNFIKKIQAATSNTIGIGIMNDDDDINEHEEDAIRVEQRRRKNTYLRKADTNASAVDFIVLFIIASIFIALVMYFIIQYLVISSYNDNSNNIIWISNSLTKFLAVTNLVVIGSKIRFFDNGYIPLVGNINTYEEVVNQLKVMLERHKEVANSLQKRSRLSGTFYKIYNQRIGEFPLITHDVIETNVKIIDSDFGKNFSFDSAVIDYYNSLRDFIEDVKTNKTQNLIDNQKLHYANKINQKIIQPFLRELQDELFDDFEEITKINRRFVVGWYAACFALEILLFLCVWKPIEYRLQKMKNLSRFLVLLIPTKIIMSKKGVLEILKKENLIILKK